MLLKHLWQRQGPGSLVTSLTAAANKRLLLVATKSLELSGTKMRRKTWWIIRWLYARSWVCTDLCIHSWLWILVSTCAAWAPSPSPGLASSLAWDYLHPDHNTAKPPPFPIHRPAMDPLALLLLSNISYLLSPFSWLAVWHFLVFETAGVSFQTERRCQDERSGLFPFWNKWSVVSEWAAVSQDDRGPTFQRRAGVLWQSKSSAKIT